MSWIRIRIQQLKLLRIHADPDPQPCRGRYRNRKPALPLTLRVTMSKGNVNHFFVFCFRTLSDRSGGEGGDGGRMDRKSSTPVSTRYHRQISPLLVEEGTPPPPGNPRRTKFRCDWNLNHQRIWWTFDRQFQYLCCILYLAWSG